MPGSRWVPHLRRCQPNCRGTASSGEALAPPPSLPPASLGTAGATGIFGSGERASGRSSLGERHLSRVVGALLASALAHAPSTIAAHYLFGNPRLLRSRRIATAPAHSCGRSGSGTSLCAEGVTIRSKALPFDLTLHKAQSDDVDRTGSLQNSWVRITLFLSHSIRRLLER